MIRERTSAYDLEKQYSTKLELQCSFFEIHVMFYYVKFLIQNRKTSRPRRTGNTTVRTIVITRPILCESAGRFNVIIQFSRV